MTGCPEPVAAVRTAKQFLTYVASGPFQYAVAEALALPDSYYDTLRTGLRAKRDLLAAGLRDAGSTVYQHPHERRPSGVVHGLGQARAGESLHRRVLDGNRLVLMVSRRVVQQRSPHSPW